MVRFISRQNEQKKNLAIFHFIQDDKYIYNPLVKLKKVMDVEKEDIERVKLLKASKIL